MNFLALVNRARRECGVSGPALASIATDSALSAEGLRFKQWINEAWREIQTEHGEWNYSLKQVSFNTTAGTYNYTLTALGITDLGNWKRDTFRAYSTAQGYSNEQIMPFMEYETYRNVYRYGNMRDTRARPVAFSISPADKSLLIGPVPDDVYTVVGEYYGMPTDLTVDADEPTIPDRYHMLIVYKAMISYAGYEAAPEVMQRGIMGEKKLGALLRIDQLPILHAGAPLA